jgi:phosphoglycerol transferase MdoB-like AlkP superfamily enzyme
MKKRLLFFGRLAMFWMLFFELSRILFFAYHLHHTQSLAWGDVVMPLLLGLRMDAAMTGYWLLLPGLLLMSSVFLKNQWLTWIHGSLTLILLFISVTIVIADLELYKHWGFRINNTPLMYISSEAAGSINPGVLVILMALTAGLLIFFIWGYYRWIHVLIHQFQPMEKKHMVTFLVITGALIIPIRSSFSVAPLNTGVVYFHKSLAFPNHAGINPVWNFFKSLSMDDQHRYTNSFYPQPAASQIFETLIQTKDVSASVLNSPRPNIILIILESFTAKIIEPLGGKSGVTPQLNALVQEGILFDHFYSSGDRTDKGLVSILSGYPAQPRTSIIKFPEKTQTLPSLPRTLLAAGYHPSFMYGGDIGFANMESYLTNLGFLHITDDDDFESDLDDSKWGIPDHYVFERLKLECDTARSPFFKTMLSLSSHEPFEVPMEPVYPGKDEASLFLNSCFYTDKSLGEFIASAKKASWWDQTLIIITADHGHRFPDPNELKDKERFKIPMLWLGGALNTHAIRVPVLAGQTDMAATLLSQLNVNSSTFTFSKNVFAKDVTPFATYIFQNGYGFVSPSGDDVYDFDLNDYLKQSADSVMKIRGKSYMQVLFDDFNNR